MRGSTWRSIVVVGLGISGALWAAGVVGGAGGELDAPIADVAASGLAMAGEAGLPGEDPPAGDLFKQARRVAEFPDPSEVASFWLTDRELYLLRPAPAPGLYQLVLMETGIPGEQLLTPFNDRFTARLQGQLLDGTEPDRGAARYGPPPASLSPDGHWLLWRAGGSRTGGEWIAAPLDNGQELRWSPARLPRTSSDALWRRDSREWVELVQGVQGSGDRLTRIIHHSLDDPHGACEHRLEGAPGGIPLGTTHADEALVRDDDPPVSRPTVAFTRVGLRELPPTVRRQQVRLPRGARLWEVTLSPAGRQLAWLLSGATSSSAQPERFALWVSELDGARMRELGWMACEAEPSGTGQAATRGDWPQSVRWLPGGRDLSFVYRRALYTVPVERGGGMR